MSKKKTRLLKPDKVQENIQRRNTHITAKLNIFELNSQDMGIPQKRMNRLTSISIYPLKKNTLQRSTDVNKYRTT